jgi:hypothetical protein
MGAMKPVTLFLDNWSVEALLQSPATVASIRSKRLSDLRPVVSSWMLYEIARDGNRARAEAKGRLLDHLSPLWLKLQNELAREELAVSFWRHLRLPVSTRPIVPFSATLLEAVAVTSGPPPRDVKCLLVEDYVRLVQKHPELLASALDIVRRWVSTTKKCRREKKSVHAVMDDLTTGLILRVLPTETPGGLAIPESVRTECASRFKSSASRVLDLHRDLFVRQLSWPMGPTEGDAIDFQNAAAGLVYCDAVCTDKRMAEIIRQIRRGHRHRLASVLKSIREVDSWLGRL